MSNRPPPTISWIDIAFQKVRSCHKFLWNLFCCCGCIEKYVYFDISHSNCARGVENYLCCLRDVYSPIPKEEFEAQLISDDYDDYRSKLLVDRVWFAKGASILISLKQDDCAYFESSCGKLCNEVCDGPFSIGKEVSNEYTVFGCLKLNHTKPKSRDVTVRMKVAEILMEKVRRAQLLHPVSVICFEFQKHSKMDENLRFVEYDEWDLRALMESALTTARLNIDLLLIDSINCGDLSVLWETISFKHFAIANPFPLHLNEKMLSCGFLGVNGPISNPESLKTFNGFGLLLRTDYLSTAKFYEEIEKFKSMTPSCLQLLTMVFSDQNQDLFEETKENLLKFSLTGSSFKYEHDNISTLSVIPMDETQETAILISKDTISFAATEWRNSAQFLEHLMLSSIIPRF